MARSETTALPLEIITAGQRRIATLVFCVMGAALAVAAVRSLDWDYVAGFDFRIVWSYRETLFRGFAATLAFTLAGIGFGILIGTLAAMASQSRWRFVRWLIAAYVEFWRDTPLLVQLIWIHFALPYLTGIQTTVGISGLIGLTLNTGAYHCEIVRAGIEAVPRGQWEAAYALGLPGRVRWRRVILPQAIRIIVPPTVSLFISVFKATAILSILSVSELMRQVVGLSNFTYKPVEFYTAGALIYVAAGLAFSMAARHIERRFRAAEG